MFSTLRKYLIAGGIAASLALVGGAYLKGRSDASGKAYQKQIEATLKDYGLWDKANVEAENLSDLNRCVALGGLRDDCERQLRGEEATKGE